MSQSAMVLATLDRGICQNQPPINAQPASIGSVSAKSPGPPTVSCATAETGTREHPHVPPLNPSEKCDRFMSRDPKIRLAQARSKHRRVILVRMLQVEFKALIGDR